MSTGTGVGSRVRVQVPDYESHTRDLFRSRFTSTGPGSQVQVQILSIGSIAEFFFQFQKTSGDQQGVFLSKCFPCSNKNSVASYLNTIQRPLE